MLYPESIELCRGYGRSSIDIFEYTKTPGNTFPILCHSNNYQCHTPRINFSMVALFFLFLCKAEVLEEITAHLVSSSLDRDLRNSKLQTPEELGVVLFADLCCDYSEVAPIASSCEKVSQPSESQPEVIRTCNAMTQVFITPSLGKPSVPTCLHFPCTSWSIP